MSNFNPLPSYEGRPSMRDLAIWLLLFQSTPLIRGETRLPIGPRSVSLDFNPLPSYEGRLTSGAGGWCIAIHFNPLPSCEGRRQPRPHAPPPCHFNPLPSYEGRLSTSAMAQARGHFNPLPSHEGRQEREIRDQVAREFQSTPLSRGKTIRTLAIGADTFISIRSPLTRGDSSSAAIAGKP